MGPTQPGHSLPFLGCKTLQKHWASYLASVFGAEVEAAEEAGPGRCSVPGTSVASLCVRLPVDCLLAWAARSLARSLSPHVLHLLETVSGCQAARASAAQRTRLRTGVIYIASTWGPCAVALLGLLQCSPGEETGGTLQPTMKSWQLIAVVGDALQVRREKALNAAREGETEREKREGWRAGRFCRGFPKPTDSREGVEEGRGWGRATEGRSVQIDIFGCLWQRSRRQPLSNVHAERVAAAD